MQSHPIPTEDFLDHALALLEKEQREFERHWIWDKLNCEPEEFFRAFRRHVESLPIPKAQWERAYQKAHDEIQIKTKEKISSREINLLPQFMGLKV